MKNEYPDYSKEGMDSVRSSITDKDKKILNSFISDCRMTCGNRSIQDIEVRLLQARDIIGKPFDSWTKEDMKGFTGLLNNSQRTEWTKHNIFASVKRFVKWFYISNREDKDKQHSMIEVMKRKRKKLFNFSKINDSTILTPEDIEKLIRTTESLRMKAFIMLQYETGGRPEEIRTLEWKNIKFFDDHADVNIYSKKTSESRTIPIKESVIHLKRWKQEYCLPGLRPDYLIFPGKIGNVYNPKKVMSQAVLSKAYRNLGIKAGIDKKVYPYLIRHTRLTSLYSQLPEHLVKKFAGHSADSDMPGTYSHISNKDVKDAMLDKIYHVEEITPERKHELENKIEILEQTLEEVKKDTKLMRKLFDLLNHNLSEEVKGKTIQVNDPELLELFHNKVLIK